MKAPQCTPRSPITQPVGAACGRIRVQERFRTSCLFELRVPLDKLFRAATWEAYGNAAVFVIALDPNNGSDAEARMTNFAPQHGIGVAAALCGGAPEGTLSRLAARSCF